MILVTKHSKAYKPTVFFGKLVYKADYWVWQSGVIPDGPGAYATNEPVHRRKVSRQMRREGLFCAAVPTLFRRMAGLEVPTKGNPAFDGGIAAYFDGEYGKGYFHDVQERFDYHKAVEWAQRDRKPVLLGKGYFGNAIESQGHTGLLLPSGYVLESVYPTGLRWSLTLREYRGYWEDGGVMVRANRWIDLTGDELRRQRAGWAS